MLCAPASDACTCCNLVNWPCSLRPVFATVQAQERIQRWYEDHNIFASVDELDEADRVSAVTTGVLKFNVNEVQVGHIGIKFVDDSGAEVKVRA